MGKAVCAPCSALKAWAAAGLLCLLTGCTMLPAAPETPAEPAALASSATPPTPAATPPAPSVSRLSDFIARRLLRKPEKPAAETVPAPVAEPVPALVDEKYRLTGEAARELERGHASWYGGQFHGRRTASGENYDKYALTAAHKTLPFGTIVRVRSLKLGREVDVRINDRGPFSPGRVIDVSEAAAEALGLMGTGSAEVSLVNVSASAGDAATPSRALKKPSRRTPVKPANPYRH